MKHVYLHIGLHKTGTTYMQKVFTENREKLRSLGVEYPELGTEFLLGHHNVAWSFIPKKRLIQAENFTLDRFFAYIETCECSTILLSSEDFDFLKPIHIAKLRDRLSNFDVKIVIYIRHPLKALYSYWQESVKHGDTRPFKDYCLQLLDKPTPLKYGKILSHWSNKFGLDALSIIVYDNLLEDSEDIALYCLQQVLGIDTQNHSFSLPKARVNSASDVKSVELIRQLNHLYKLRNNTKTISNDFFQGLKNYFNKNRMDYTQKIDDFFVYETIAQPQYKPLHQFFRKLERRTMRMYGDRILNAKTENTIFKSLPAKDYKIISIDTEAIYEALDLEEMYNHVISGV